MPTQKPGRSKQDYATPKCFIKPVKQLLGIDAFTMDFAADAKNKQADAFWGEKTDSLSKSTAEWVRACQGGWGWLNPPYRDIRSWVWRCVAVKDAGGSIACLVPASVGSNWFRDCVHGQYATTVLYLNGRLPFMPDKPSWLFPKDCMLILYGAGEGFYNSDIWTWR